jgi:hypothetical protein
MRWFITDGTRFEEPKLLAKLHTFLDTPVEPRTRIGGVLKKQMAVERTMDA